jgi:hypothetical protein
MRLSVLPAMRRALRGEGQDLLCTFERPLVSVTVEDGPKGDK